MRKLVHEEIDREIADKSVHLAYRFVGKPTAKAFLKALSIFPGMPAKAVEKNCTWYWAKNTSNRREAVDKDTDPSGTGCFQYSTGR